MKNKKIVISFIILAVLVVAIVLIIIKGYYENFAYDGEPMGMASGEVLKVDMDCNEVTLKLDDEYIDDFSGNETIILELTIDISDEPTVLNIINRRYVGFLYWDYDVEGNRVKEVGGLHENRKRLK